MPPRKSSNLNSSEDESIEVKPSSKRSKDKSGDGGDVEPPEHKNKKSKITSTGNTNGEVEVETNEDGDSFFKLSEARRLTVRTFKGKVLVDIRETYKDKTSGQVKYGAKGISLTKEQWDVLRSNIDNVDDMIAQVKEK